MENYAYVGQPFTTPVTDVDDYAYNGQPFELWQATTTPTNYDADFFQLF